MKILIFCTANLALGSGSEIRARLIAEGMRYCGADVFVVASGVPEQFSNLDIKSSVLPPNKSWSEVLLEAVNLFKPDVLYGITEALTNVVADVAHRFNIPYAFDIHGLGFIEVIELGRSHPHRLRRVLNSLKWLSRIPFADVVTVANPTLLPIVRPFNRFTEGIIGMTDVSHFTPEGKAVLLGNDRSAIQFLYAGNFFAWQGVELLIKAIKQVLSVSDCCEFTILGSVGRQKDWADRLLANLPKERVLLQDSVDYMDVPAYYRGADVLLLPRPYMMSTHLAFPQKLVDYMASGKAVLATSLKPHVWALADPQAGLLCQPTAEGLASGFIKATDRNKLSQLGVAARSVAVEQFCHFKQCRHILALFKAALLRRGRS